MRKNALWLVLGFLIAFTIAVTARYNQTVQVVDSVGNIFGGTASALTAAPSMVVRIVDSAGNVLDSLGATGQLAGTGSITLAQAATPTGMVVTPTGGTATQRCYRAACVSNGATTLAEAEVCDAAGPTVLDATHFETVKVTFPELGCDHMQFYGRATGAELATSSCPGGTNCIAAAGGFISWKDDGSQAPSGALPTFNGTGIATTTAGLCMGMAPSVAATVTNYFACGELSTATALAAELNAEWPAPTVCTVSDLRIHQTTAANANLPVYTIDKAAATPSNVTCSVANGANDCTDTTDSFQVAAGALLSLKLVQPASANATGIIYFSYRANCQ